MAEQVAVGVADHAGWAVLVTVGPAGALLDRRRIELVDEGLPALPHHNQGQWAIGRYTDAPWARPISLDDAVDLIDTVRASAERHAREGLAALATSVPGVGCIALRESPPIPASTEARIRDVRAQTFADGVMYREALAAAAAERGWAVRWYDRKRVFGEAAAAIGAADLDEVLRAMGRAVSPPWQVDHKLAAAAALAAGTGRLVSPASR